MSMHIEGPWLSTTGKQRGRKKWASAEHKRQHEQLTAEWEQLKSQHAPAKKVFSKSFSNSKMPNLSVPAWRQTPSIPSLNTGAGVAARRESPVYTGTKVKGIGTMHKSNAVPVFSDEEAVEISQMRRN
jgi:hypothetical protein